MNYDRALEALTSGYHDEGGILEGQAVCVLELVKAYGQLHFPFLWDGPDSWDDDVQLYVRYLDETRDYTVEFSVKKRGERS